MVDRVVVGRVADAGAVEAGTVVVLTGLPGTGKSTLADRFAREQGCPAFAGDWLLGALAPHGILTGVPRATVLAAYHDLLLSLIRRQVLLGQSAVVDCVVDDAVVTAWRAELGGRLVVVETVCGDEELHRRRIEGRTRGIPGWHEVGWDHVERMRAEFRPVADKQLTLDAVEPVEHNLRLLAALVREPPTS